MAHKPADDLEFYVDPLMDTATFKTALNNAPNSYEFTKFVHILVKQIKIFFKIKYNVLPLNDPEKYNHFLAQISCCLREMGCPYIGKIVDKMSSEAYTKDGQLLLVDYLMFKLMTGKMIYTNTPGSSRDSELRRIVSPPTVVELRDIVSQVDCAGVPANVNLDTYLTMLECEIKNAIEGERKTLRTKNSVIHEEVTEEWDRLENEFIKLVSKYRKKREEAISEKQK